MARFPLSPAAGFMGGNGAGVASTSQTADLIAPAPSGDTTGATDTAAVNQVIQNATGGTVTARRVQLGYGTYYGNFVMAPMVTLQGAGWGATRLKAPASSTLPVIGTPGVGGVAGTRPWMVGARVRDLAIDGNVTGGATSIGCWLSSAHSATNNPAWGDHSATPEVDHVAIFNCGNHALVLGEATIFELQPMAHHLWIYNALGNGILVNGPDALIDSCQVGVTQSHGVSVVGGTPQITNVKAWYTGSYYDAAGTFHNVTGAASADGFHLSGVNTGGLLEGCLAQDCGRYSFALDQCKGVRVRGSSAGWQNGSLYLNAGQGNDVDLSHSAADIAPVGPLLTLDAANGNPALHRLRLAWDQSLSGLSGINLLNGANFAGGTDLEWGNEKAAQSVAYAATINPFSAQGAIHKIPVNGALTVGPTSGGWERPGIRLTLIFTQDATGHAITWDASYHGAPAVPTTANSVFVAEFINTAIGSTASWQYVA